VNKIKISEEQFDSLQEDLDMRKDEKFNASRTVQRAETRIGEPNERERLESPFTSCRSRCARNNEYQAAKALRSAEAGIRQRDKRIRTQLWKPANRFGNE